MKKTIFPIILWLFVSISNAQSKDQLLTILEKDPDNLFKKDSLAFTNRRFADINSTLHITLNKQLLNNKISQRNTTAGLPNDIEKIITVLEATLQNQAAFMSRFKMAIINYNPANNGTQAESFNSVMKELARVVLDIQKTDPLIKQYAQKNNSIEKFVPFFDAVKQRLTELKQDQESVAAARSNKIQLGAWLIRDNTPAPVHLQGFDNLPKGEYYEVARWNFIPTEAQLSRIYDLQKNSYKGSIDVQSVFNQALDSFKVHLSGALNQLQLEKIINIFDLLKANQTSIVDTLVKRNILELQNTLESDASFITEKIKFYNTLNIQAKDIVMLTEKVIADYNEIDNRLKALTVQFNSCSQNIKKAIEETGGNIKLALSDLNIYLTNLPTEVHKLIDALKPEDFNNLKKQYDFHTNTLQFSKDILKFSLKELPSETQLDLRRTGARSNGDHVVFKLVINNEQDSSAQVSEESDMELQLLASHVEGTVGVVLAMPVSPTPLKSGVQVVPYYNILFKGFRNNKQKKYRENGNNNDLFAMNFGIHASIPDFNLDGVPEFGVGGVVSFLKDYVQAGWAFNFFEKTGYWFFGTRFPIGPFGANSSAASRNALNSNK